jgi:hypothetical protein
MHATLIHPLPPSAAHTRSEIDRALDKLEQLRDGRATVLPVRRHYVRCFLAVIFGGGSALVLGALAAFMQTPPSDGLGPASLLLLGLAAVLVVWTVKTVVASKPSTPARALRLFYRALGGGCWKRAARLVVPNDFDQLPRQQPNTRGLGQPESFPWRFDEPRAFAAYWGQLLRDHPLPYCLSSVRKVKVHELAPDLVLVDFELRLVRNTQLWFLLIPLGFIPPLIIDCCTRKVLTTPMHKLMHQVNGSWRLFNGAWAGSEEEPGVVWARESARAA